MRTHQLLLFVLIGLCGTALSLASSQADERAATHPCLEALSPLAPTGTSRFSAPADIITPAGNIWLLDGILVEHLKPASLAQQKQAEITKVLKSARPTIHASKKAKPDRRGRRPAFIQSTPEATHQPHLLQEQLAAMGLVRIDVDTVSNVCAKRLLNAEQKARQAKLGLWKEAQYQPKPSNRLHLSAIVSTYQLVYGRVRTVSRMDHSTSYLNFGPNWKKDFTVTLSEKSLTRWEAENKSLDALKNAYIYVRGWVETRGGPLIRVHHPEQLWQEKPPR
ncbi:thermonuclease family protein [Cohaesibacter intestini]|uniref:thermonuclease family protein n=1 Tax=Cohaesibacter intestini TaxID=2211145 RepID=UPI00130046DE|nr:thermonuclease family protein [Cohaesibacter intestini]